MSHEITPKRTLAEPQWLEFCDFSQASWRERVSGQVGPGWATMLGNFQCWGDLLLVIWVIWSKGSRCGWGYWIFILAKVYKLLYCPKEMFNANNQPTSFKSSMFFQHHCILFCFSHTCSCPSAFELLIPVLNYILNRKSMH